MNTKKSIEFLCLFILNPLFFNKICLFDLYESKKIKKNYDTPQ